MHEGKCVQMMHVGPFDKEPENSGADHELLHCQQPAAQWPAS